MRRSLCCTVRHMEWTRSFPGHVSLITLYSLELNAGRYVLLSLSFFFFPELWNSGIWARKAGRLRKSFATLTPPWTNPFSPFPLYTHVIFFFKVWRIKLLLWKVPIPHIHSLFLLKFENSTTAFNFLKWWLMPQNVPSLQVFIV